MNGHGGFKGDPEVCQALVSPPEPEAKKRKLPRWMIVLIIGAIASFAVAFFILLGSPQAKS
jgi:hypothetical protein